MIKEKGIKMRFVEIERKVLDSIYLEDRFCEKVEVKDNRILFQINCISRLKEGMDI